MKHIVYTFVLLTALVSSIQRSEAQQTPQELKAWAKENAHCYHSRSDVVILPFAKQQALYNLLDPAAKAEIWRYKWQDIKNSQLLSAAEKKELKKLYRFARPQIFDNERTKIDEKYEKVYQNFQKTMTEDFNWTDKEMFAYCECSMTEDEIRNYCRMHNLEVDEFL